MDTLKDQLAFNQERKRVLEAYQKGLKQYAHYKTPNARIKPLNMPERTSVSFEFNNNSRATFYWWGTGGSQHRSFYLNPDDWYSSLQEQITAAIITSETAIRDLVALQDNLPTIRQDEAHIQNLLVTLRNKWNTHEIPKDIAQECPLILGSSVRFSGTDNEPSAEY